MRHRTRAYRTGKAAIGLWAYLRHGKRGRRAIRSLLAVACSILVGQSTMAQNVDAGARQYGFCVACHGVEGRSGKPLYPILDGQTADYLVQELADFKSGVRRDPNMTVVAQMLDEQSIRDLAAYFGSRETGVSAFLGDGEKVARGKRRAEFQCRACHSSTDRGVATVGAGRVAPRIDGQNYEYLLKQLGDFRLLRRDNDGGPMRAITSTLSDSDIDDLASYFSGIRAP